MVLLRVVFGMLFLAGIFFAAFAWILIPLPIGILLPQYRFTPRDTALSLSGSILSLSGYFVWINWLVYAWSGRFVLQSEKTVQWIAIANSLGWMFYFPYFRNEDLFQVAEGIPLVLAWIVLNFCVATGCLLYFCAVSHDV
ncbi:MAG: hypothetical protein ACK5OC_24290 [Pirellula sp.]